MPLGVLQYSSSVLSIRIISECSGVTVRGSVSLNGRNALVPFPLISIE